MKSTPVRAALLLSTLVAALLWAPASTSASGPGGRGVHLTRNGFRTPLFGVSQVHKADGTVATACASLTTPQVDTARFGRRVSRALVASSPRTVVRSAGGATFDVTYTDARGTGFNDTVSGATRRRAFEAALAAWTKVLKADQTIRVEASMYEMDDGDDDPLTTLLATAGPTDYWILDDTAVPSALAWQMLGGRYENAGDSDIIVDVNDQADWDYAVNGAAVDGKFSFVYTLMHELAHGLGYVDSFDIETGTLLNDPLPFVFDVFVNRGSSRANRVMDHASAAQKRDLESGDLFFNGANAAAASKASIAPLPMVKLYAPKPYESGSSVSHVDQDTYSDFKTGLMTPLDFGSGTNKIDTLTLAIMKDLGYELVPNAVTARTP
jgi:hypothetical protein